MGNFDVLPLEIMLEILSRVPIESLLECKLVSKPWRNLLQHPSFSKLQIDSAHDSDGKLNCIFYATESGNKSLYYTEYDDNLDRFNRTAQINLRTPFDYSFILGSCNGLVCIDNIYCEPAYICNPITKEYISLPIERKSFVNGFGYSPSTNEFKVVRINCGDIDPDYRKMIQVYTLGSGIGWRNVGKMDYCVSDPVGMFVNGAIHWMDESKDIIISFDLADEEFRELPLPPCMHLFVKLHVLSGFLCACCYQYDGFNYLFEGSDYRNKGFDIWVLLEKNTSIHDVTWSKEYRDIDNYIRPISFTKSGGLLCYDHRDKSVYKYSSKASSSRMLVSFGMYFDAQVPHKNTLVSLKALGEENSKLMGSGVKQDLAGDGEQSLADELYDFKLAAGLVFTEALGSASQAVRRGCINLVLLLQKTKRQVMNFLN